MYNFSQFFWLTEWVVLMLLFGLTMQLRYPSGSAGHLTQLEYLKWEGLSSQYFYAFLFFFFFQDFSSQATSLQRPCHTSVGLPFPDVMLTKSCHLGLPKGIDTRRCDLLVAIIKSIILTYGPENPLIFFLMCFFIY